jgi:hypothetical protein
VLIENGGIMSLHLYQAYKELNLSPTAALLHDDDEVPVPEEEKATFYAQAESEVRLSFYFMGGDT